MDIYDLIPFSVQILCLVHNDLLDEFMNQFRRELFRFGDLPDFLDEVVQIYGFIRFI